MNDFKFVIKILTTALENRKKSNPRYSLRAFARDLKIDASTLSAVINGKRYIPFKNMKAILDFLNLSKADQEEFEKINQFKKSGFRKLLVKQREKQDVDYLDGDNDDVTSSPYMMALLCYLKCDISDRTLPNLSKVFALSEAEMNVYLNKLLKLKLIKTDGHIFTSRNSSTAIELGQTAAVEKMRHGQKNALNIATERIKNKLTQDEYFASGYLAVNKKNVDRAKMLLREFGKSLCQELEQDASKKDVYLLNFQFIPMTNLNPN